jgi:hypothetical protein
LNVVTSILPSLGGSFHGEDARDSLDLSLRLALGWRLHERGSTRGRQTNLFGHPQTVDRENAIRSETLLEVEQSLNDWIFLRANAGYGHVSADPSSYGFYFAGASLGARWP